MNLDEAIEKMERLTNQTTRLLANEDEVSLLDGSMLLCQAIEESSLPSILAAMEQAKSDAATLQNDCDMLRRDCALADLNLNEAKATEPQTIRDIVDQIVIPDIPTASVTWLPPQEASKPSSGDLFGGPCDQKVTRWLAENYFDEGYVVIAYRQPKAGEKYILNGHLNETSSWSVVEQMYDYIPDGPRYVVKNVNLMDVYYAGVAKIAQQKAVDELKPQEASKPLAVDFSKPLTSEERKRCPVATGVLDYWPDALQAVANCSYVGTEQHNAGQPMHWAREKSKDHADCIVRHLAERGTVDTDGVLHAAKVAWRSLSLLQLEIERMRGQK